VLETVFKKYANALDGRLGRPSRKA
jgi:hypothetical protein